MTASKEHLARRAVALRKQKLSLQLIGRRLGCTGALVVKYLHKHAPELIGNVAAQFTLRP